MKNRAISMQYTGRKTKHAGAASPFFITSALIALALLAYSNSFQSGFVLDSKTLLLQDPRIQEITPQNIALIFRHTYWWPHGESYLYRPFATLSYLFNYAFLGNGDRATGYHWINFALHAGNVLLVFVLVRRLARKFWPAAFTAAIWAVHPALTESVTNIVGRPDLLAAMALLSALLFYLKSRETTGALRWCCLTGLMAITTIGVFSKETAVAIPVLIALYELVETEPRFSEPRPPGSGLRRKQSQWPLLACFATLPPIAAFLYLRSVALAQSPPMSFPFGDNPLVAAGFWTARLTALKIMARYLGLMIWPAQLSSDYSYAQIPLARGTIQDWIAWLVIAAMAACAVLLWRRNRPAFFLLAFAFVTFLPASNLLFPIGSIMAERFLYLPSVGLIACAVLAINALGQQIKSTKLAPAIIAAAVTVLTVRTWLRNADWRDDLTLSSAAARVCPKSYKTHAMLATALFESDPEHKNIDNVIEQAERSLAPLDSLPDWRNVPAAYTEAGKYYLVKGDLLLPHALEGQMVVPPESARAYRRSLQLLLRSVLIFEIAERQHTGQEETIGSARYVDCFGLLSTVYLRLGNLQKALDAAVETRALSPDNPAVYRQLSGVQLARGDKQEAAIALLEGAIATSDPGMRDELINLYRNGPDESGCAVIPRDGGFALNPSCAMVHDQICTATAEVIRLRIQTHRSDLAEQVKHAAEREFGCPA